MTFFLVIDQVFQIFRIFTVLNVVYDVFFTRKMTISENSLFYSVRTFTRIRQHCFSKYWGGYGCMGRPHLKFFGGTVPPVLPRSPPLISLATRGTRAGTYSASV